MSLFQRRHFMKIAQIASKMNLKPSQFDRLCMCLATTNANYDESRFRAYYQERLP